MYRLVQAFAASSADPEKIVREGPTLTTFFLADEGREDQNITISSHHRPASETPFKWRFADGPMIVQHGMLVW